MWRLLCTTLFVGVSGIGTFGHITDLHYDPSYKVGVSTLGYCRSTEAGSSGRFGAQSNRCDSPLALVKETLVWIATHKPKVDFLLVTGDLARRTKGGEIRNQTDQQTELTEVSDLLDSLVAEPMIVLPTIGASDLFPEGDCEKNDTQFQKLLTATWEPFLRPWLQDANNLASFSLYGCYNATVEGFGVILLNTEFWSQSNGASGSNAFCDEGHAGHQVFTWLESVITGYRDAGMKVLIAGNRDLNTYRPNCATLYVNMSVLYEDTILGHVYGGTHEDSFNLISNTLYPGKPKYPGVIHVSPSVLPVYNPAVRIYEFASAGDTLPVGTLKDYVQYYADVAQANRVLELAFVEEYRATTAFGLANFSTAAWFDLFNIVINGDISNPTRKLYERYRTVSSEARGPTPAPPPDTIIGVVFTVICGVLVLLASLLAWYKCRSFKYKTYEQELADRKSVV